MRLLIFSLVMTCLTTTLPAQSNWPEYRGPNGDGQAPDANLPVAIDEAVVKWQTPIHGKGWSSPVVWGDQIWLTTATKDGTKMYAICVDRQSGKVIHDLLLLENAEPAFCHPLNSYATPTPIVEAGRVYIHFGSYLTTCLDSRSGEVLWKRLDLECDHHRGPASSPILHDGKLFVAYDGFDVQYVVAFDKNTGETVWKQNRNIEYGTDNGDRMKAYCTAHVIDVDGKPQLICPSAAATVAYNPADGKTLWKVYHQGMNASARPLYGQGLVFITNGMGSMVAVKPTGSGDVTATHIAWSDQKGVAKKSSQLLIDGLFYMTSDDGIVTCREPETGEIVWQRRAKGDYAASPIYADGRIYLFSMDGDITTLEPGRKYKRLAETKLGDGFMASPAIVNDQMILRSKSTLYSIEN
ncbi:PQQ-binding-like beta-propeller repeat protein [Rubripirellula sp.]|jgi:outer membrane protein assembly factor BamB|nr:PQQ-binding-like beta-propeller repeat protein [Rubripirellula sp.]